MARMVYKPNMSEFDKKFAKAAHECSAEVARRTFVAGLPLDRISSERDGKGIS